MVADSTVGVLVVTCSFVGLAAATWFAHRVSLVKVPPARNNQSSTRSDPKSSLLANKGESMKIDINGTGDDDTMDIASIQQYVAEGANAFLYKEYEASQSRK